MATETAVRISRKAAFDLVVWCGWKSAGKWDNERMQDKLPQVKDVGPEEPPDDEDLALVYQNVMAAIEEDREFEVFDSEDYSLVYEGKEIFEGETKQSESGEETDKSEPESKSESESEEKDKSESNGKSKGKGKGKGKGKSKTGGKKKAPKKKREIDVELLSAEEAEEKFGVEKPQFEVEEVDPKRAEELLQANLGNRPYSTTIAKRYAEEIIRREWHLTLEPIIFDRNGVLVSGQHRLGGLLQAEAMRQKAEDYYENKYGWDSPVTVETAIAYGADPGGNDHHDRGQKRSGSDVLFRRGEFLDRSKEYKEADFKKLTRDLATAVRLVWLKLGQKKVSDAPHFPHSEMIEFIENHPKLKDFVEYVYNEDAGRERKISKWVSCGYMAGMAYLFAASDTDYEDWNDKGELEFSKESVAQDFVSKFAAGTFEDDNDPIHQLREWFSREMSKDDKPSRDTKINLMIKAWKAYVKGDSLAPNDMKMKKKDDFSIGEIVSG